MSKEILAWGAGKVPSVYEVSDLDLTVLSGDPEELWEAPDMGWAVADRYRADFHHERKRCWVNGLSLTAWHNGRYPSLMEYLAGTLNAFLPVQFGALAAELSAANGCKVSALFTRYQPVEVPAPAIDLL